MMNMYKLTIGIFTILLGISCSRPSGKVSVFKQWHLAPNIDTTNTDKAKTLPQFESQVALYRSVEALVKRGEFDIILSEGCDQSESPPFQSTFNGWDVRKLKLAKEFPHFENLLAPVAMKVFVYYPKESVEVLCGDSSELIKKHQLAFSDLSAFLKYFQKFQTLPETSQQYQQYLSGLRSTFPKENITNPIEFVRKRGLKALADFEFYLKQRNKVFVKLAHEHPDKKIAIILGGSHALDLERRFKRQGRPVEVFTPKGYPPEKNKMFENIEKIFNKKNIYKLAYFNTPDGFKAENFPLRHLLKSKEIATTTEWQTLAGLAKKVGINPQLLLSDFDQDNIRDFTLSLSGTKIVLAAEDNDWDNDGFSNLLDNDLQGLAQFKAKAVQGDLINSFKITNVDQVKILDFFKKRNINLLHAENLSMDLLVVSILYEVLKVTKKGQFDIENIKVTDDIIRSGRHVYFGYSEQSRTMYVYWGRLIQDVLNHKKNYPKETMARFLKGYITPLMIHSMAHELGHALKVPHQERIFAYRWKYDTKSIESTYLKSLRMNRKKIFTEKSNLTFDNKKVDEWAKLAQESKERFTFLKTHTLPSFYALKSPEEWFAEVFAMCVLKELYPKVRKESHAKAFFELLGINPMIKTPVICSLL